MNSHRDILEAANLRFRAAATDFEAARTLVERVRAKERLECAVVILADALAAFREEEEAKAEREERRRRKRRARPAPKPAKPTEAAVKPSPATLWQRLTGDQEASCG